MSGADENNSDKRDGSNHKKPLMISQKLRHFDYKLLNNALEAHEETKLLLMLLLNLRGSFAGSRCIRSGGISTKRFDKKLMLMRISRTRAGSLCQQQ